MFLSALGRRSSIVAEPDVPSRGASVGGPALCPAPIEGSGLLKPVAFFNSPWVFEIAAEEDAKKIRILDSR